MQRNLILLCIVSLFWTACGKQVPRHTSAIPNNATAVFAISPKEIFSKLNPSELKELKFYDKMQEGMKDTDPETEKFVEGILKDPTSTGIDLFKDAFIFGYEYKEAIYWGTVLKMQSKSKFEKMLQKAPADVPKDVREGENCSRLELENDLYVCWDKNRLLFLATNRKGRKNLETVSNRLMNLEGDDQVSQQANFQDFATNSYDVGLWMNLEEVSREIKRSFPFLLSSSSLAERIEMDDSFNHIFLSFAKGKTALKGQYYLTGESRKVYEKAFKGGLSRKVANLIPNDIAGMYTAAFNPEVIKESIGEEAWEEFDDEAKAEVKMTGDEIMSIAGGEVAFIFHGVEQVEYTKTTRKFKSDPNDPFNFDWETVEKTVNEPMPLFSGLFLIGNQKKAKELIEKVIEKEEEDMQIKDHGDYQSIQESDVRVFFGTKNNVFVFGNNEAYIKDVMKGRVSGGSHPAVKKARSNPAVAYFGLHLDDIPEKIVREIKEDRKAYRSAKELSEFYKHLMFVGGKDGWELELALADESTNSLNQFIRLSDEMNDIFD